MEGAPLKPIPQTVEAANELTRFQPDLDVLAHLQSTADRVQEVVPDCVGMSIAWVEAGVAFTLVASDEEIAVLDALQYLAGGPCVVGVELSQGIAVGEDDLLGEEQWRLFSAGTAARAVRSTLTLPLTQRGEVHGSANLYAASDHAFEDHHEEIALILGGSVSNIISNADLSFSTRGDAERAPQTLRSQQTIDHAIGLIASSLRLDLDTAAERLAESARRAGITTEQFARALMGLWK